MLSCYTLGKKTINSQRPKYAWLHLISSASYSCKNSTNPHLYMHIDCYVWLAKCSSSIVPECCTNDWRIKLMFDHMLSLMLCVHEKNAQYPGIADIPGPNINTANPNEWDRIRSSVQVTWNSIQCGQQIEIWQGHHFEIGATVSAIFLANVDEMRHKDGKSNRGWRSPNPGRPEALRSVILNGLKVLLEP